MGSANLIALISGCPYGGTAEPVVACPLWHNKLPQVFGLTVSRICVWRQVGEVVVFESLIC